MNSDKGFDTDTSEARLDFACATLECTKNE